MWGILRNEIRADVALLQEVKPPEGTPAIWHRMAGVGWGTAIASFGTELDEVTTAKGRANKTAQTIGSMTPGTLAVGRVKTTGRPLTFVSLYGAIGSGYADATVNTQLSDLVPLFDDPEHKGSIILGGDFNITTQWTGSQARYRDWEATTFQRVKAFGLADCLELHRPPGPLAGCNCLDGPDCRHIQTQRHSSSKRPWQNDYLFASNALIGKLRRAYVHDSEAIRDLGDHMPLVAEFDILS
jgi:exonuclease III